MRIYPVKPECPHLLMTNIPNGDGDNDFCISCQSLIFNSENFINKMIEPMKQQLVMNEMLATGKIPGFTPFSGSEVFSGWMSTSPEASK